MLCKFGNLENATSSLNEGYIYMNEFHNFKDDGEKIHSALYFQGDTKQFGHLLFAYIESFYSRIFKCNEKVEKSDLDNNILRFKMIILAYQYTNIVKIIDFLSEQENILCIYCFFNILKMLNIICISVFFPLYISGNSYYFDICNDRISLYIEDELQKLKTQYTCDRSKKCYDRSLRDKYPMLDIIWNEICNFAEKNKIKIDKGIWDGMFYCMEQYPNVFAHVITNLKNLKKDFFYSACCFTTNTYDDLKMYDDYGAVCLVLEPIERDNKLYFEVSRDGINFTLEEIHKVNYGVSADYFNFFDSPKKEDILKYHSIKDDSYLSEKEYRVICKTSEIKDKKLYIKFEQHLKKIVLCTGRLKEHFFSKEDEIFCNVLKDKTRENHNWKIEVHHMVIINKSKHIHKEFTISKGFMFDENGRKSINGALRNKKMYEDLVIG